MMNLTQSSSSRGFYNELAYASPSSTTTAGGGGGGGGAEELDLMDASPADVAVVEREHMFDKVVTPSDVGKLNRLVIPKQHAERYFPLDSSTNEKGLLLNFEDRNGKPWRFRYSYWNSSQSYVMTKGWSRFVKEKKLDAGDVVSFQRGVGELGKDRLFIDWRRRPDHSPDLTTHQYLSSFHRSSAHPSAAWNPLSFLPPNTNPTNYQSHYGYSVAGSSSGGPTYGYNNTWVNHHPRSVIYLRPSSSTVAAAAPQIVQAGASSGGVGMEEPMVFESVPVVQGKAAAKRLRLFGVNMDCPISEVEPEECEILSSTTAMAALPPHLSSTPISPHHLRLYNASPLPQINRRQGKSPKKSFDLDI